VILSVKTITSRKIDLSNPRQNLMPTQVQIALIMLTIPILIPILLPTLAYLSILTMKITPTVLALAILTITTCPKAHLFVCLIQYPKAPLLQRFELAEYIHTSKLRYSMASCTDQNTVLRKGLTSVCDADDAIGLRYTPS
jgi:hypothetical protein